MFSLVKYKLSLVQRISSAFIASTNPLSSPSTLPHEVLAILTIINFFELLMSVQFTPQEATFYSWLMIYPSHAQTLVQLHQIGTFLMGSFFLVYANPHLLFLQFNTYSSPSGAKKSPTSIFHCEKFHYSASMLYTQPAPGASPLKDTAHPSQEHYGLIFSPLLQNSRHEANSFSSRSHRCTKTK